MMLLSPPKLAASVPVQWRIINEPALLGTLASAMHRHGILRWQGDVLADVEASLAAHAETLGKHIASLDGHYTLNLTDNYDKHLDGNHGGEPALGDCALTLTRCHDSPLIFDPRRAVNALEAVTPRLGFTILRIFEEVLSDLTGCCGPWAAEGMAEYHYWFGETDDIKARQEAANCQDCDIEDVEFELTRAQFDAEFPKGMFTFKNLSLDQIKASIPRVPKKLRPLLEAIPKFLQWNSEGPSRTGGMKGGTGKKDTRPNHIFAINSCDRIESFLFFWKPYGMVGRVFDDYYNAMFQSDGPHPYSAICTFHSEQEESIIQAFRNMDTIIDRLAIATGLLPLLARQIIRDDP